MDEDSYLGKIIQYAVLALVVTLIGWCVYDSILVSGFNHHFCLSWHSWEHEGESELSLPWALAIGLVWVAIGWIVPAIKKHW